MEPIESNVYITIIDKHTYLDQSIEVSIQDSRAVDIKMKTLVKHILINRIDIV
jgi:hypothetical protein